MKVEYSNLDLLRAFAVSFVVISHVLSFYGESQFRMLGPLGVSLFFVHTCLVLMQSLERQKLNGSPLFVPFLIRRCFRIYPLAVLAVAVTILFHIPQSFISPGHFQAIRYGTAETIANLSLTQGVFGVFRSIVGPMWSLAYEMQMYVLLPAIYLMISSANLNRVLVLWFATAFLSVLVCSAYTLPTLFFYAPCFMAGVVAYKLVKMVQFKIRAVYWPMFLLLIACITTSEFLTAPLLRLQTLRFGTPFEMWWIVCALVGFSLPFFEQITATFVVIPVRTIAKYSYGIYLSHFFCMWVVLEKMSTYPLVMRAVAFPILLALISVALFEVVEKPCINFGKLVADKYTSSRPELFYKASALR